MGIQRVKHHPPRRAVTSLNKPPRYHEYISTCDINCTCWHSSSSHTTAHTHTHATPSRKFSLSHGTVRDPFPSICPVCLAAALGLSHSLHRTILELWPQAKREMCVCACVMWLLQAVSENGYLSPQCSELQKNKADGPTDPQQPAKKKPPADFESLFTQPVAMAAAPSNPEDLLKEIAVQGDKIRSLKAAKAGKVCVTWCWLCC